MFRRISVIAAITMACLCSSSAHAQFGGLRVQFGGYGNGVRIAGYGNNYGNGFRGGYAYPSYASPYNNVFNGGYYNNPQPYSGLYPNFGSSYVAPFRYAPAVRAYTPRRFRYR